MVKYQFTSQDAEQQTNQIEKYQEVIQRQAIIIEQLEEDNYNLKLKIEQLNKQLENTQIKKQNNPDLLDFKEDQLNLMVLGNQPSQNEEKIVQNKLTFNFDLNNNKITPQQSIDHSNELNSNKIKTEQLSEQKQSQKTTSNTLGSLGLGLGLGLSLELQGKKEKNDNKNANQQQLSQKGNQQLQNNQPFNESKQQIQPSTLFGITENNKLCQNVQTQDLKLLQISEEKDDKQQEPLFFGEPSDELKIYKKKLNQSQEEVQQLEEIEQPQIQLVNQNQQQKQQIVQENSKQQSPQAISEKEVELFEAINLNEDQIQD